MVQSFKYRDGDLLNATTDVIAHQTNCSGGFGTGVAGAVRKKYPSVFDAYKKFVNGKKPEELLGKVQFIKLENRQYIVNLFGQKNFGYDGAQYTSYDAIWNALQLLKINMFEMNLTSVAFPYLMASHRGGANWEVIEKMIEQTFKDTDISVEIWKL